MRMKCNPSLYHYGGYCFNKSRIPDGQIAIREIECTAIDRLQEGEVATPVIASR